MSLRVTVEDIEEGGSQTVVVPDGEYFILTTAPCYLSGTQVYPKAGTHVLTIKGRRPKRPVNCPTCLHSRHVDHDCPRCTCSMNSLEETAARPQAPVPASSEDR